ncbi:MAG: HlyD family efflux transporter periplasmic adaptor subunit [Pseudomonadales bacterium]
MSEEDQKLKSLTAALEDHSAEGIAILTSEPPYMAQATILLLVGLLMAAVVWSFFGRADVIVTASGNLSPDSEVRRFYAPIEGELIDIYITEGQPVAKNDVLARLNARGAIRAANSSLEADLQLSSAKRELQRFPARERLMERQIAALERQIKIAETQHQKRVADGMSKLAAAQKAKLEEARGNMTKADRARTDAERELAKFQRLNSMEGGGGISRNQVEEKRSEFVVAKANYELAKARLSEMDSQLSSEYEQAKADLEGSDQKLTELQIEHDNLLDKLQYEANKVRVELRSAELEAEAASRISFDNIDEDNFLRILAPDTGVITEVAFTQPGDKIQANTPLGGIAAEDARPLLKVEILERDRAFLRVGQEVRIKFNAFAYQRYGFIEGTLEYVSPSTQLSDKMNAPVYKGRVTLERDYFQVDEERYPLRYGMEATAEIVVRKRRLIDLALDPFRKMQG